VFGLGEHHRPDHAVSAPAVALAEAGTRTKSIRLTSAVSVLSSDDPVRVFQQFATPDNLTRGRAEIVAGRGSFMSPNELSDYDALFTEKLELLMKLNEGERIRWPGGRHTPASSNVVLTRGRTKRVSRFGSRSAERRNPSRARVCSTDRSLSPSSAASRRGSPPYSISTGRPPGARAMVPPS